MISFFDELVGGVLVRIIYYIGPVFIGLGMLSGLFGAITSMGSSFIGGLGMLLLTPIAALIAVLFWRFFCEIYIVLFRITEQLNDIKVSLKPAA